MDFCGFISVFLGAFVDGPAYGDEREGLEVFGELEDLSNGIHAFGDGGDSDHDSSESKLFSLKQDVLCCQSHIDLHHEGRLEVLGVPAGNYDYWSFCGGF